MAGKPTNLVVVWIVMSLVAGLVSASNHDEESSDSKSTADGYNPGQHPPKHVMKLMQRLSQDKTLLQKRGNTIRSYLPTLRFACHEPTYVFTMRRHVSEDIQSMELHYFAPKPSTVIGSSLTLDIHLHLITDTSSTCQPIAVQQRQAETRGWQDADFTPQMSELMNTTSQENSKVTVGVSFRVDVNPGPGGLSRDSSIIEKIVSNHARPFFLMFADEDSKKESALPWSEIDAKYSRPEASETHSRHTRSVDNSANSIVTNEFPDGGTNHAHEASFQHFTEQDSKRRKAKKRTGKRRKGSKKAGGKEMLLDPPMSSSVAEDRHTDPEPVPEDRDQNTVLPMDPSKGPCSKHPMFVSFDTIDWDRYVIAPTGFQAFYCAGDCSFPVAKTGNPSNHATIQSVMSVAGVQPKIPPPCCVPEKLSSLSILFFDQEGNLVLKTYQNMVVESCGCR